MIKKIIIAALVLLAGCRVFTDDNSSISSVSLTPNEQPTATITLQAVSCTRFLWTRHCRNRNREEQLDG